MFTARYKFRSVIVLRDNYVNILRTILNYVYPYTKTILNKPKSASHIQSWYAYIRTLRKIQKYLYLHTTNDTNKPISANYIKI